MMPKPISCIMNHGYVTLMHKHEILNESKEYDISQMNMNQENMSCVGPFSDVYSPAHTSISPDAPWNG